MVKAFEDMRKLGAGDRRPADDSKNNRKFLSEVQKGLGFFQSLPCLNGDAASHSGRREHFLEILRKKISGYGRHIPGNPAVLFFRITPEMVVGVNSLNHRRQRHRGGTLAEGWSIGRALRLRIESLQRFVVHAVKNRIYRDAMSRGFETRMRQPAIYFRGK